MMRRRFGHLGFSLVLIAVLGLSSGCGLQLRGGLAVPERLQSLYLQGDERSPIFQTVERSFEFSGVTLVNSAAQAPFQIKLIRAQHQRRSVSLNENAKTQEYELRAQLSYSIEDHAGTNLVKPTVIYTERTYGYDKDHVNAKEAEEELLLQEMRENLAQQLVRRYLKLAEIHSH